MNWTNWFPKDELVKDLNDFLRKEKNMWMTKSSTKAIKKAKKNKKVDLTERNMELYCWNGKNNS